MRPHELASATGLVLLSRCGRTPVSGETSWEPPLLLWKVRFGGVWAEDCLVGSSDPAGGESQGPCPLGGGWAPARGPGSRGCPTGSLWDRVGEQSQDPQTASRPPRARLLNPEGTPSTRRKRQRGGRAGPRRRGRRPGARVGGGPFPWEALCAADSGAGCRRSPSLVRGLGGNRAAVVERPRLEEGLPGSAADRGPPKARGLGAPLRGRGGGAPVGATRWGVRGAAVSPRVGRRGRWVAWRRGSAFSGPVVTQRARPLEEPGCLCAGARPPAPAPAPRPPRAREPSPGLACLAGEARPQCQRSPSPR